MAHVTYRVSGRDGDRTASRRFPDTAGGRDAARAFATTLEEAKTVYDVRYRVGKDERSKTFARRKDADAFVTTVEANRLRGVVVDPRRARVTVKEHADGWLAKRHDLAERTIELYRYLLDKHILPKFGEVAIGAVSPSDVGSWQSDIAERHATTAAKAYRLLRELMNAAVVDELIVRNPCQLKRAGTETAPPRPVATFAEVQALADAMPTDQRIAVLLAAWCQLRKGELLGMRRKDVDLLRGTVTVEVTKTKTMAGEMIDKAPKSDAGRRSLSVPPHVLPELERHLDEHVGPRPADVLLAGGDKALRTAWDGARRKVGVTYRLHDLRHAGLTWSAATGATTAELMRRGGHASPTAALRYQHATEDRDKVLADALAAMVPPATVLAIPQDAGSEPHKPPRDARGMKTTRSAAQRGS